MNNTDYSLYTWPLIAGSSSTHTAGGNTYIKDYMTQKYDRAELNRKVRELETELRRVKRYLPYVDLDNPFS